MMSLLYRRAYCSFSLGGGAWRPSVDNTGRSISTLKVIILFLLLLHSSIVILILIILCYVPELARAYTAVSLSLLFALCVYFLMCVE